MAGMQYEATLRLKGDDQTAEAFRSASESARRFADQQTRATRGLREDVDSVGRAFRGLRRTALVGGLAGVLTQAVTQAANFGDKLNRIGINARATEDTITFHLKFPNMARPHTSRAKIRIETCGVR